MIFKDKDFDLQFMNMNMPIHNEADEDEHYNRYDDNSQNYKE